MSKILYFLGRYLAFEIAFFNVLALGIFFNDKGRKSSLSFGMKFFKRLFAISIPLPRFEHHHEKEA